VKPRVIVDLDGVLASWKDGWQGSLIIGDPTPGARDFLRRLRAQGWEIVIFTCRCYMLEDPTRKADDVIEKIKEWLDTHGMVYDSLHTLPCKPLGFAYIDDRAVFCNPDGAGRQTTWDGIFREVKRLADLGWKEDLEVGDGKGGKDR